MKKAEIFDYVKVVALALVLYLGLSYVAAWTGPTLPPPQANVPAPLNVGTVNQKKDALLYAKDFCLVRLDGTLSNNCLKTYQHFEDFSHLLNDDKGIFIIPPGVTRIKVQMWGGGGGGGGGTAPSGFTPASRGRGGGGAGGYAEAVYSVNPGESYSYIVGKEGARGTCGDGTGNSGGLSSFSGHSRISTTALGGGGGAGDTGGAGGGAQISYPANASEIVTYTGSNGLTNTEASGGFTFRFGRNGGNILYSAGGLNSDFGSPGFHDGGFPGGGGAGGSGNANCSGGDGARGRIVVWW